VPRPTAAAIDIDLWRAELDLDPTQLSAFISTLSPDEADRSRRFHRDSDRDRFVAGRGWLRCILGDYLSLDPSVLRFAYDSNGKPRLAGAANQLLRFNMSHSDGIALYAVCTRCEVGVDVERVSSDVDVEALAQRFFSAAERVELAALSADDRRQAFFDCWTRKEAYLKAVGIGLGTPTQDFSVTVRSGSAGELTVSADRATRRWSLYAIDAGAGYAAAVAVEGTNAHVTAAPRDLAAGPAPCRSRFEDG
jgi:4'-phosphopantetheinyl transferase